MTKSGKRSSAPQTMTVTISVPADHEGLIDIEAVYLGRGAAKYGDPLVHYSGASLLADLDRTLLALDFDGSEFINPDYV